MIERDLEQPLLRAEGLSKWYGKQLGCRDVSFALYPGEVIAVVGESGSGKTTLLQLLSAQLAPSRGRVRYCMRDGATRDLALLGEAERRFLFRTDWGYVHQDPALGLRMSVSAGANVGERLMAIGWRHYGQIRQTAGDWLARIEIDGGRIDDEGWRDRRDRSHRPGARRSPPALHAVAGVLGPAAVRMSCRPCSN